MKKSNVTIFLIALLFLLTSCSNNPLNDKNSSSEIERLLANGISLKIVPTPYDEKTKILFEVDTDNSVYDLVELSNIPNSENNPFVSTSLVNKYTGEEVLGNVALNEYSLFFDVPFQDLNDYELHYHFNVLLCVNDITETFTLPYDSNEKITLSLPDDHSIDLNMTKDNEITTEYTQLFVKKDYENLFYTVKYMDIELDSFIYPEKCNDLDSGLVSVYKIPLLSNSRSIDIEISTISYHRTFEGVITFELKS